MKLSESTKKILIVGDAGRGKTTLASKIATQLDVQLYSTDDFFWKQKYTVRADQIKSIEAISKIYTQPEWVVEGTTRHLIEPGMQHADIILHLRFSSMLQQWWVLYKRYRKRRSANNERFGDFVVLARHVFQKRYQRGEQKNQQTIADLLLPYSEKVIELSSYTEMNEFR